MQLDKTLGGSLSDYLTSVDVVGTSGFVLAGYSNSPASGQKTDSCRGITDYWIIRMDKRGNVLWEKTYGGKKEDYATSIKSFNGNFLVGGYSNSAASGDKTTGSRGGMDFWTLILDKNGSILEQNTWGGTGNDFLVDYMDGGSGTYLLAGTSLSPKGRNKGASTVGNTGKSDFWVFRIAPSGTISKTQINQPAIADSKADYIKNQLLLNINPNPVKDMVNLIYNASNSQQVSLSVYTNSGRLVNQQTLSQSTGTYAIDLSAQPAGIYYAVLQSGSSSITKKFIKN